MTNEEVKYKQCEDVYRKGNLVISREYGRHENGNMFGGCWVVRNIVTGEYVDNDRNRNDLFNKYGFSLGDFGDETMPLQVAVIQMLTKGLVNQNFSFEVPFGNNKLVIKRNSESWTLVGWTEPVSVDAIKIIYYEKTVLEDGEVGFYSSQLQHFHPADINEAIECFIGRSQSIRPFQAYQSKHDLTLEQIHSRELLLKATHEPDRRSTTLGD